MTSTSDTTADRVLRYVERFPCPLCLAPEGKPCTMGESNRVRDDEGRRANAHGDRYHAGRFRKAARAAIDTLMRTDGVRYDEAGACDEREVRRSSPADRDSSFERFRRGE